jgi:hypothetical protein
VFAHKRVELDVATCNTDTGLGGNVKVWKTSQTSAGVLDWFVRGGEGRAVTDELNSICGDSQLLRVATRLDDNLGSRFSRVDGLLDRMALMNVNSILMIRVGENGGEEPDRS